MSGQDPSEIIMATVDEERKGTTFSGTVILGIDPEAGEALFFRDFLIEDYKGELTACLATDGDIKKSIDAGCSGHLTKPIKKSTLLRAIAEFTAVNIDNKGEDK